MCYVTAGLCQVLIAFWFVCCASPGFLWTTNFPVLQFIPNWFRYFYKPNCNTRQTVTHSETEWAEPVQVIVTIPPTTSLHATLCVVRYCLLSIHSLTSLAHSPHTHLFVFTQPVASHSNLLPLIHVYGNTQRHAHLSRRAPNHILSTCPSIPRHLIGRVICCLLKDRASNIWQFSLLPTNPMKHQKPMILLTSDVCGAKAWDLSNSSMWWTSIVVQK